MKNILIGGTGFIGTALAEVLVKNNEEVISISRNGRGSVSGVQYEGFDIADTEKLNEIIDKGDDIFILTGQISSEFNAEQEKKNLRNIAAALLNFPEKKVYYASSVYVYGNTDIAADEMYPCHPIEAYSKFKLEAEQLLQELLPDNILGIFRFGNVYGSPKNRGIIGLAMKKLFEPDETPLMINGDGSQKRDYIFLDDVVGAMSVIKNAIKGSDTINIASGESISLLDVIEKISEISGKKIPYEVTNIIPNEIRDMYISNEKLKMVYGYTPRTSLDNGIRKTFERYEKQ